MRFYLFDRVTGFEPGVQATGIKNVAANEDFLIGHFDRYPVMPPPLIVEALAQLGGWTVTLSTEYRYLAIMVMLKGLTVHGDAAPGDQLTLNVRIENLNEFGAAITAQARIGDNPVLTIGSLTYALHELSGAQRDDVRTRYQRLAGPVLP